MKVDKAIKATFNTNLIILNGFLVALLVGTILLMLPGFLCKWKWNRFYYGIVYGNDIALCDRSGSCAYICILEHIWKSNNTYINTAWRAWDY